MKEQLLLTVLICGFIFAGGDAIAVEIGVQKGGPRFLSLTGDSQMMVAREVAYRKAELSAALREKASFRTGADGRIKIRVAPELEIEVFPDSEVEFPGISWDSGEVPVVALKQGRVRWIQLKEAKIQLKSAMYEVHPPLGDFVFFFFPKVAEAGLWVLKGETSFRALNAENSVSLSAGEKVQFNGVIEEGEIAYDILLKGRRIPRGALGKVEPLTPSEKNPFEKEDEKRRQDQKNREQAVRRKKSQDQKEGMICKLPSGRLNECSWICEKSLKGSKSCQTHLGGVTCVRHRCNANGEWADRWVLPADEGSRRCGGQAKVGPCDY